MKLFSSCVYAMSCFRFPKKLCRNLTSIFSKFWWGSKNGERKVHWVAWDRMCRSKRSGDMGFRDFQVFNQALVAKQAWRLVINPDSLCARVLKHRYFVDKGFLDASCPKSASFTWKSIIWGRELLKEGLVWRVGDGSSIKIWDQNWIPREGACYPLGYRDNSNVAYVSDLLDSQGRSWNEATLRRVFHETDVRDIQQVLIGGPGKSDFPAWNYTKNGQFTVRSPYHLKMDLNRRTEEGARGSSSVNSHKGWL